MPAALSYQLSAGSGQPTLAGGITPIQANTKSRDDPREIKFHEIIPFSQTIRNSKPKKGLLKPAHLNPVVNSGVRVVRSRTTTFYRRTLQ
jgi:hypothetical protein